MNEKQKVGEFATLIWCPVANFMAEKEKFKKAHPKATIVDEIKTLQVVQAAPQPKLIGIQNVPEMPMFWVGCVIYYTELVIENSPLKTIP